MVKLALIILSVFLLLVTSSEAGRKADSRIVGGMYGKISEIPYIVSIQRDVDSYHFCGGSIIAPRWILTAAHCIMNTVNTQVRAGSAVYSSGGKTAKVIKIIRNKNFNTQTTDSDIALMQLDNDITGANGGKIIALPDQDTPIVTGQVVRISGWGLTSSKNEHSSSSLQTTEIDTIDHQVCKTMYPGEAMPDSTFCAARPGRDACSMDSGGPLALNNTQLGIVSWGFDCADPKYPGVYTKVSKFRNWIKDNSGV